MLASSNPPTPWTPRHPPTPPTSVTISIVAVTSRLGMEITFEEGLELASMHGKLNQSRGLAFAVAADLDAQAVPSWNRLRTRVVKASGEPVTEWTETTERLLKPDQISAGVGSVAASKPGPLNVSYGQANRSDARESIGRKFRCRQ